MKALSTILLLSCALVCAHAQKTPNQLPDLQKADNAIFDPSRPEPKEVYRFGIEYRLELGYNQNEQRSNNLSYPNMFLHGGRVGATFDFLLPYHFTLQTGVLMNVLYGTNSQHWRDSTAISVSSTPQYLLSNVIEWNMTIPVRCYYIIPLWKKLNMFFFTGPDITVGLIEQVFVDNHLSETTAKWVGQRIGEYRLADHDRYTSNELYRCNVQWGLGGGFEWDGYRLQAGYDFGLNNLAKNGKYMTEWGWFVTVAFRL